MSDVDVDTIQRLELLDELRKLSGPPLAAAVLELIEDNRERWQQGSWRWNGELPEEKYETHREDPLNPVCKTSFCAAGWVGAIDGVRWSETIELIGHPSKCNCTTPRCAVSSHMVHISDYAAARLGLNYDAASRLFNGDNTLEDLQDMVAAMARGDSVFDVTPSWDQDDDDDEDSDDKWPMSDVPTASTTDPVDPAHAYAEALNIWWMNHANLATLAEWMFQRGDSPADVVYMLEKPWKFETEFHKSQTATEEEMA